MTPTAFIKGWKQCNSNAVVTRYGDGRLMDLKEYIGTLDFDCQFKDGMCKRRRGEQWDADDEEWKAMCCCSGCAREYGYLQVIAKEYIPNYAEHFSPDTGFWRPKKGCTLPYRLRSTTCVTYNCRSYDYDGKSKSDILTKALWALAELMSMHDARLQRKERR
jgi:hypothetical protein